MRFPKNLRSQKRTGEKSIRCASLGTALKLPMTEATLIENSIMMEMGMLFDVI